MISCAANLARAIADVGWSEIVRKLEYKSAWYGRTFVQIDRFYPSSTTHDRDINAAVNIREAGLAIIAGADMLRLHEKDTGGPPEL